MYSAAMTQGVHKSDVKLTKNAPTSGCLLWGFGENEPRFNHTVVCNNTKIYWQTHNIFATDYVFPISLKHLSMRSPNRLTCVLCEQMDPISSNGDWGQVVNMWEVAFNNSLYMIWKCIPVLQMLAFPFAFECYQWNGYLISLVNLQFN